MDAWDNSLLHLLIPESRISQAALSISVLLTAIFVSVYITTWLSFVSQQQSQEPVKVPPTLPYMAPFVGSAISFALNPAKHLSTSRSVPSDTVDMISCLQMLIFLHSQSEGRATSCSWHEDIAYNSLFPIQAGECSKDMEIQDNHNNARCHSICPENFVWDGP